MGERKRSWTQTLLVLCVMAAVAVSVIYLPQSMLRDIASDLGVSSGTASLVATAVQLGYAIGIVLFVPLADRVPPRKQVTVQTLVLIAALLIASVLPTVASVVVGFLAVGLVANIAQIIIPAANRMEPHGQGGRTTSALLGALLIGIFGGRVIASLTVDAIGWRWVTAGAAVLLAVALPFARGALAVDAEPEPSTSSYPRLVASTFTLIRESPVLVQSTVMQFFIFATFNSMWTVMVLHLTDDPIGWTVQQAGLFGLIGLAAGFATPFVGRFVDRFGALVVSGILLIVLLAAAGAAIADSTTLVLFGITMFFVTWCNQSIQSATQSRGLQANPQRAAQANTIYMGGVFLGGSAGAYLGAFAYDHGGMQTVAIQAVVFVAIALLIWMHSWRALDTSDNRFTS
ncbi:MAG: MFS transporter [Aeromicrobium sp.]